MSNFWGAVHEESPSLSNLTGDYLFASAFSQHDFSQQALVESAFSAQHAAVESHFSAQFAQAEASVAAAAAAPSAAFLFEFPQQPTHQPLLRRRLRQGL